MLLPPRSPAAAQAPAAAGAAAGGVRLPSIAAPTTSVRVPQPGSKIRVLSAPERGQALGRLAESARSLAVSFPANVDRALKLPPLQRPSFSGAWVDPSPPPGVGKPLRSYRVEVGHLTNTVEVYRLPGRVDVLYHLRFADYDLTPGEVQAMQRAQSLLKEYRPGAHRSRDLRQMRQYVYDQSLEVLRGLPGDFLGAASKKRDLRLVQLAEILTRHRVGYGILEVLLNDADHVQDIYVDAPSSENPVHLRVGGFDRDGGAPVGDKCITNIRLIGEEAEAVLARFVMSSGRPFSEAMPVLETDLHEFDVRVTVVGKPLSPEGIAMALRRHASDPWTLARFLRARALPPEAAGLLAFLIDGRSTMLVAGARGAGKTTMVGALMLELPQNQRTLTIEDTLELPCAAMSKAGWKVQSIYVRSAVGGATQMTADDALRVSLRLGESAIVMGEVRGQEAKTLYEAMRAGTAGSTVLGTIHGNSSRAIWERVVHDLGISASSFAATDIVVVMGLRNPAGSVRSQFRAVTEISEFLKEDPEAGRFEPLMTFDEEERVLKPTPYLLGKDPSHRSQKVASIAEMWNVSYEEALTNIFARGRAKARLAEEASRRGRSDLLGIHWTAASNAAFWEAWERACSAPSGSPRPDVETLASAWETWFQRALGLGPP